MTKIQKADIAAVSKLARIKLTTAETTGYQQDLVAVLDYMKLLNEVDTKGVEPTFRVTTRYNVLAPDEPRPSLGRTEMLENAPNHGAEFINVKGVVNE